jgi:hypothetical protein
MINSTKSLNFLAIMVMVLILFTSCSNSDDDPATVTTYKLTMEATPSTEGNTNFSTISYNNEDGTTITLSDTNVAFSESFDISFGFTILFNVSGTNDATNPPSPTINWRINRFENNVDQGIICVSSSVSVEGSAGFWSFNSNNNSIFDGTSCQ